MNLKAIEILTKLSNSMKNNEGIINWDCSIDFFNKTNEAIKELEALIEKDKSKKCEECYKETNRVLALVEQRESDAKHTIIKLTRQLETLENRKCTDCKFFTKNNAFYGICVKDVNTTKNQDEWLSNIDFSCNRFEQKES